MSGQRGFIYLNKRPRSPEEWGDIACDVLNLCVWCLTAFAIASIGCIGGFILWWWLR